MAAQHMGANDLADLAAIRGLQDRAGEGNGSGFELGKKIPVCTDSSPRFPLDVSRLNRTLERVTCYNSPCKAALPLSRRTSLRLRIQRSAPAGQNPRIGRWLLPSRADVPIWSKGDFGAVR